MKINLESKYIKFSKNINRRFYMFKFQITLYFKINILDMIYFV